jgi:phage tail-like protein
MAQNPPQAAPTPAAGAQPAAGVWQDPYRAYQFKVMIQGVAAGHFTECSGLGATVEPIAFREAGNNQVEHRIPGQVRYQPVTLKYGLTSSHELFDWFMTAVHGNPTRKNVSILLLDSSGATEVMRWNLISAWISSWRGAVLDALTQEIAIESVTIVFESLQRA